MAQNDLGVNVRFVTFPVLLSTEPVELYLGKGESVEIQLPTNSLSKPYRVNNVSACALGKSGMDEEGNPKFDIYGQTPLLSSREQIILVTLKGREPSEGLELTAFDSSRKGFNGGKYLLMNASKADIAGNLGASKFALRPNQHMLLAPKASEEKNNRKYLYTKFFFRSGETTRPFYTSTWRFSEQARCMVFFHHDPHSKQLRTHTIRNYLE